MGAEWAQATSHPFPLGYRKAPCLRGFSLVGAVGLEPTTSSPPVTLSVVTVGADGSTMRVCETRFAPLDPMVPRWLQPQCSHAGEPSGHPAPRGSALQPGGKLRAEALHRRVVKTRVDTQGDRRIRVTEQPSDLHGAHPERERERRA
jgi:hypothetical protein